MGEPPEFHVPQIYIGRSGACVPGAAAVARK
jgi:hypothetical protein